MSVDGKRKSFYGTTRQEAAKKLRDYLTALEAGRLGPSPKLKTGDYLRSWLSEHAKPRVRAATFTSYEVKMRLHGIPAIGHIPLIKLSPLDVERMLSKQLRSGVSARSVQHHRAILRGALNDAMRWPGGSECRSLRAAATSTASGTGRSYGCSGQGNSRCYSWGPPGGRVHRVAGARAPAAGGAGPEVG